MSTQITKRKTDDKILSNEWKRRVYIALNDLVDYARRVLSEKHVMLPITSKKNIQVRIMSIKTPEEAQRLYEGVYGEITNALSKINDKLDTRELAKYTPLPVDTTSFSTQNIVKAWKTISILQELGLINTINDVIDALLMLKSLEGRKDVAKLMMRLDINPDIIEYYTFSDILLNRIDVIEFSVLLRELIKRYGNKKLPEKKLHKLISEYKIKLKRKLNIVHVGADYSIQTLLFLILVDKITDMIKDDIKYVFEKIEQLSNEVKISVEQFKSIILVYMNELLGKLKITEYTEIVDEIKNTLRKYRENIKDAFMLLQGEFIKLIEKYEPIGKIIKLQDNVFLDKIGDMKIEYKLDKHNVIVRIYLGDELLSEKTVTVEDVVMNGFNNALSDIVEVLLLDTENIFIRRLVNKSFIAVVKDDGIHVVSPVNKFYKYGDKEFIKDFFYLYYQIRNIYEEFKEKSNMPTEVPTAYKTILKLSDGTVVYEGVFNNYYLVYNKATLGYTVREVESFKTKLEAYKRIRELIIRGEIPANNIKEIISRGIEIDIPRELIRLYEIAEKGFKDTELNVYILGGEYMIMTKTRKLGISNLSFEKKVKEVFGIDNISSEEVFIEIPERVGARLREIKHAEKVPQRILSLYKTIMNNYENINGKDVIRLDKIPYNKVRLVSNHGLVTFIIGKNRYSVYLDLAKLLLKYGINRVYYKENRPVVFISDKLGVVVAVAPDID